MKRNLLYLLILLLLAFLTYYFVFREDRQGFGATEDNFTVANTGEITRIRMSNLQDEVVTLSRINGQWMANDSFEVIQSRVDDLLDALSRQRAIQPVRLGSHDEVIREMSADHVKVEVFGPEGITNTFYVAKKAAPNNLTYMLSEGGKRPYIVKIPVHNYFLGVRYSAKISEWRTRRIMHARADEIAAVDVNYLDSAQYSFHLSLPEGAPPAVQGKQPINKPLNLKRVQAYLQVWDSIYCYGFEKRTKVTDTIFTRGKQLATVTLKKKDDKVQDIAIYFKPITKGSKAFLVVGKQTFDFDLFLGFLDNRDLVVLPRSFTQAMLRSYPEFYETDPPIKP